MTAATPPPSSWCQPRRQYGRILDRRRRGVAEIVVMMTYPGEAGEGADGKTAQTKSASAAPLDAMTLEELRAELELLRDRDRQIAELLNCRSPDCILHDLRNLLNEVQLLRILAEQGNA
jgi:hypothetical protein